MNIYSLSLIPRSPDKKTTTFMQNIYINFPLHILVFRHTSSTSWLEGVKENLPKCSVKSIINTACAHHLYIHTRITRSVVYRWCARIQYIWGQSFERPIRQFYDRIRDDLLENRIRFQILFSQRRYFFIRSLYFKTVKNFLRQRRFVCIRIYKNVSISFRDAPDIRIIRSFIIYPVTTDNKIWVCKNV